MTTSTPGWRRELADALSRPDQLRALAPHRPAKEIAAAAARFPARIPRPYAALIDPADPADPIAAMVVPDGRELRAAPELSADPLAEERDSPLPGLVHRYPDRVLLLVTGRCATHCRYCMRRRVVGRPARGRGAAWLEEVVAYLAARPAVREVILSGGDPLLLSDERLGRVLRAVRSVPHVEIVRVDTRAPVALPSRVTADLVRALRRHAPLWVVLHACHPRELTPDVVAACDRLADAGIPLLNQAVLLAGVNDRPGVLEELSRALLRARVRPYYLHQCDLVDGAGHFRTPLARGVGLVRDLCGRIAGMGIPRLVVDTPGGHGKVALAPGSGSPGDDGAWTLAAPDGTVVPYPDVGGGS